MNAPQEPVALERGEIAPHRLRRDVEIRRELTDVDAPVGARSVKDRCLSLFLVHAWFCAWILLVCVCIALVMLDVNRTETNSVGGIRIASRAEHADTGCAEHL